MRWLLVLIVSGCASAGSTERSGELPDAGTGTDSGTSLTDSGAGAPDSGCAMTTRNLLANGNFDMGATGWTAMPIDSAYPIITDGATGVAAQSPTYRAWMGGFEEAPSANKDALYQDVMVPATTTALAFAGYYEVRSAETSTTMAYDTAVVELASTADARLEVMKELDNKGKTTAWTQMTKTIAANLAGQTVRVKLSSAGDGLYATSFYFDTLELNATYCQ